MANQQNPIATMMAFLQAQVGKAYRAGANGPDAWNCSSLVSGMLRTLGIDLPAYTYTAVKYGQVVDPRSQGLAPGDLIYVNGDGGRDFGHVMVYVGGGQVIQAANTKTGVIKSAVPNIGRIQAVRRMVDSNGALIQAPGQLLANHQDYVPVVPAANASSAPITGTLGKSVPLNSNNQDPQAMLSDIAGGFQAPTDTSTTDPATLARQLYGYLAAYLDDPEIGPILKQAAAEGWSADRLAGALSPTSWWQTTQESARKFDAKLKTDRASADADVAGAVAQIQSEALQLGLTIDPARLQEIALNSVRLGWNDAQLRKALGAEAQRNPDEIAKTQLANLNSMASDYGLTFSPDQLQKWASDVIGGTATTQQFQSHLIDLASGKYPTISDALAKGTTVKQFMDPYVSQMASALELNPNAIDLTDPKWTAVLNGVDAKGNRMPMSIDQAVSFVRSQPQYGWNRTDQANQQAASFAARLGQMFGAAA